LFEEQSIDPYQIHDRNLVVAVDDRKARTGGEGQSAPHVPPHHSLFRHCRTDDAGIASRQLPHDVRGRISAAGDEVANQHELIVVDAGIYEHSADARREGARCTAGAVAEDNDRELRDHEFGLAIL
jgi:hypothetical protein